MAPQAATLIYLRDRSVEMLKKDLILKNPLRAWEPDTGHNTATPRMGLVIAPRGAGKTAVLVQFALDCMLRGNSVMHVALVRVSRRHGVVRRPIQELCRATRSSTSAVHSRSQPTG